MTTKALGRAAIREARATTRARRAIAGGATSLLLGVALVGIGPSDLGAALALAGLLATIFGVHTFGRLGPPS